LQSSRRDIFILRLDFNYLNLAFEELNALLEAENIPAQVHVLDEFVIIAVKRDAVARLMLRSALVKEFGELIDVADTYRDVLDLISGFENPHTCVSLDCVRGFNCDDIQYLFKEVEKQRIKIGLKCPHPIRIVKLGDEYIVYRLIKKRRSQDFAEREPHRRAYYRPGTMKPILARALVNLARVRAGETLLDPFCGVGGFAIEACTMGINTICADLNEACTLGSRINAEHYGCSTFVDILQADSTIRYLREESVDGVATDPPYGRQITSKSSSLSELYERFLHLALNSTRKNRYIVFAVPIEYFELIEKKISEAGGEIRSIILNRVHGSLTRALFLVKKV